MKKYLKLWSKTVHCLKLNSVIFKVLRFWFRPLLLLLFDLLGNVDIAQHWLREHLKIAACVGAAHKKAATINIYKVNMIIGIYFDHILCLYFAFVSIFVFRFHAVTFAINPSLWMCQEIHSHIIHSSYILFPMISMISHYINIALPTLGSTTGLPWQCPTLFSTPGLGNGEEEQIQIRYGRRPLKSTPLPDRTYPGQNPQKLLLLEKMIVPEKGEGWTIGRTTISQNIARGTTERPMHLSLQL